MWSMKRTTGPTEEPVTAAEQKTHMRVTANDEHGLIATYISSARSLIEVWAGRAFINQTWELKLDRFPADITINLPRPPLSSVTSVNYVDTDGTTQTMTASEYHVDTSSEPGRIVLDDDDSWPTDVDIRPGAVIITFVAGYGAKASAVPIHWMQAIKILASTYYCNREALTHQNLKQSPLSVQSLVMSDRIWFTGP